MGSIFGKSRSNLPFFRDTSNHSSTNATTSSTPHNSLASLPSYNHSTSSIKQDEENSVGSLASEGHDSHQTEKYVIPQIEIHHANHGHNSSHSYESTDQMSTQTEQEAKEEQLRKQQQQQQQEEKEKQRKEEERLAKLAQEEEERRLAAEEAKKPQNQIRIICQTFQTKTESATERVTQLRSLHTQLVSEFHIAEKRERLASFQIQQAEEQQMDAAEKEDFDLADQLAAVIDAHVAEKEEQTKILDHIQTAIEEVDSQRETVVKGLTECFVDIQEKLGAFQLEQDTVEKEDGNEVCVHFISLRNSFQEEQ